MSHGRHSAIQAFKAQFSCPMPWHGKPRPAERKPRVGRRRRRKPRVAVVRRSRRPFCVFGANGDAAVGVSLGGEHAIYVLIDPRDGTVRYVGKSVDPAARLVGHAANHGGSRQKRAWIADMRRAGVEPRMEIVDWASSSEWERAEQWWVQFYSSRGSLYNVEVGGRGYLHPADLHPPLAQGRSRPFGQRG